MSRPPTTEEDKIAAIELVMNDIQGKHGNVIAWMKDVAETEYLSSGIAELDEMLMGGLPKGRITEVFGAKSSGKTPMACQLVSQSGVCLFVDAERKMTGDLATKMHLPENTIRLRPNSLEEAFEDIEKYICLGIDSIVVDSLPALPPLKESDNKDGTKIVGISPTAGFMSRRVPVLLRLLDEKNVTFVVVNQQRANINAPAFGEQYHTFGGLALANYASVRLAVNRMAWLKHEKLGVYGVEIAMMLDKCNTGAKPRSGLSLPLVYDIGFVPNTELADARKILIAEGKTVKPIARISDKATIVEELSEMASDAV